MLEVSPQGSKLWRWKYRLGGKENRYAIGSYSETSMKEAREQVDAARKLVKQGQHPAQQRKIERLKTIHGHASTFKALANEWLALKDWEEVTKARRLDMLTRVVFPSISDLPVRAITPSIVLDILKKAHGNNGPSVMAEAKRTMFGIFELAAETFRVEANPVHQWREALPKNKTQHKRALDIKEIGQLLKDVDGHGGNFQTQSAFMLMWLIHAYSEDDLFDVIEFLYDHSSEGVEGYHQYSDCGWHYKTFDVRSGREIFRREMNDILGDYGQGYELS